MLNTNKTILSLFVVMADTAPFLLLENGLLPSEDIVSHNGIIKYDDALRKVISRVLKLDYSYVVNNISDTYIETNENVHIIHKIVLFKSDNFIGEAKLIPLKDINADYYKLCKRFRLSGF